VSFFRNGPRGAQRDEESGEDGPVVQFKEALLSLTRNAQTRLIEPQRGQRGISEKPASEKWGRENENEGFLLHESEVEPSSGDAETESSGKGIWCRKA